MCSVYNIISIFILDFNLWKRKYEEDTNTSFAKATGRKGTTDYYYCNRSGLGISKGLGISRVKEATN